MIAVDTNILVYAHRVDAEWHPGARDAVRSLAEGAAAWAIPWPCLHEFLAIVTHPRIFRTPTPLPAAIAQIEAWLESPSLTLLAEGDSYWQSLRSVVVEARVAGPRIHDGRIAALCLSHGIRELWSADRDFSLFPDLTVKNPLRR